MKSLIWYINKCFVYDFSPFRDNDAKESIVPLELLIEAATGINEPEQTDTFVCFIRFSFNI